MNDLANLTLLVVDDEPELLEILSSMLEFKGAKVLQASDGLKAFQVWQENPGIDFILTDVNMPGVGGDGISLVKNVRAKSQDGKPPILIITGYSRQSEQEAYQAGANKVFAKPFKIDEVVAAIVSLMK